jgi:hypothetical protein
VANRTDNFNRADSSTALGTPSDGGSDWVEGSLTTAYGISSNHAYTVNSTGYDLAYLESSQSDCTVQVTLSGNLGVFVGLCCRLSDASNYWWIGGVSGTLLIDKIVAGSQTTVNTTSGTFVSGDVIAVILSGSTITLQQNGSSVLTATDSFNQTATKHGLWTFSGGSSPRWDDFSITGAGGGGGGAHPWWQYLPPGGGF